MQRKAKETASFCLSKTCHDRMSPVAVRIKISSQSKIGLENRTLADYTLLRLEIINDCRSRGTAIECFSNPIFSFALFFMRWQSLFCCKNPDYACFSLGSK